MGKLTKNQKLALEKIEAGKIYTLKEAAEKIKEITWEQVKTIAEDKMPDLNCFTLDSAMKMVAGTARSMGITVKGSFPEN